MKKILTMLGAASLTFTGISPIMAMSQVEKNSDKIFFESEQFDFNGEYDKLNEEVSTNLLKILSEWFEYSIDKEILNYNSAKIYLQDNDGNNVFNLFIDSSQLLFSLNYMIDREEDIQEIILTDYSLAIGNETNDVIVLFDFYGIDSKGRINGIWYQEYRFDIDKNIYPNFDNVKIVLEVE